MQRNAEGRALGELRRRAWYSWGAPDVLCVWCKRPLTFESMTLEHLVPKSKGGTDNLDNLAPACRKCNSSRGNRRTPTAIPSAAKPVRSRWW